ncbi:hypothetical protein M409DRAFT_29188 [Zasmidium cellare ATCC 36951]|uniref:Transcription factor domain-containing protein n=1 Tax=Zasmidium cellare ATCC 36951 TaxID=1080233 RepID=A0A6A6C234_ZASCE|nr:uncharacterized protein M409DRAFT_29188 [Zasmidium cellare ATCC 36951]KAF2160338.1 hypothetical protein M409DRAFT_29188 [Zasmidium cellare ATCC 36951]
MPVLLDLSSSNGTMAWVHVSGNPKASPPPDAVRKQVRSNAMRHTRGCQRRRATEARKSKKAVKNVRAISVPISNDDENTESSPGSRSSAWSSDGEGIDLRGHKTMALVHRTCLDSLVEPFGVLPIPSSDRMLTLLHYNYTRPIRTSVHEDPSGKYPSCCFNFAAWLYATLSHCAQRLDADYRSDPMHDSPEKLALITKAIGAVNEQLDRLIVVDHALIAAVACIANIQSLSGRLGEAALHVRGLYKILMLVGGLSALDDNPALRRLVQWSDVLYSSRALTQPMLPFYVPILPPLQDMDTPFLPYSVTDECQDKLAMRLVDTNEKAVELETLLSRLNELSIYLNHSGRDRMLPFEVAYPDRVYVLERAVVEMLLRYSAPAVDLDGRSADTNRILLMLLHACLLFIYTNLRQTPIGSGIRQDLVDRLSSAIDDADDSLLQREFVPLHCWALLLCLGAVGRTQQGHGTARQLRDVCWQQSLSSFNAVKDFCRGLPTLEEGAAIKCEEVWLTFIRPTLLED